MCFLSYYPGMLPLFKVGIIGLIAVIAGEVLSLFFRKKGFFFWLEGNLLLVNQIFFCLHPQCTMQLAFLYGAFLLFTAIFFSPVLFFRWNKPKKRQKVERKTENKLPMPVIERVLPTEQLPRSKSAVADVQLNYAVEVLNKLRGQKLKEADKIEAEMIGKTLSVYQGKSSLTPQESKTLNACLSSVLKMMSAYSL